MGACALCLRVSKPGRRIGGDYRRLVFGLYRDKVRIITDCGEEAF